MLLKKLLQISQENNLDKKHRMTTGDKRKSYYENQMNNQYKKDEKIMKDILRNNLKPCK